MAIRDVGKQYRQRNFREEGGSPHYQHAQTDLSFISDSYAGPTILSLEGYSVDIVVIFTRGGAPLSVSLATAIATGSRIGSGNGPQATPRPSRRVQIGSSDRVGSYAMAASTINAATSFGREASEAWLASSSISFTGFMRALIFL